MIGLAAEYNDTPIANNTTFQLDFPFDFRQDIAPRRLPAEPAHSFYVRYLHDKYDLIEPRGTFIGVRDADHPDQPRAPGLRRPAGAHLDRHGRTCSTTSR